MKCVFRDVIKRKSIINVLSKESSKHVIQIWEWIPKEYERETRKEVYTAAEIMTEQNGREER
jgi:hypothetical protein